MYVHERQLRKFPFKSIPNDTGFENEWNVFQFVAVEVKSISDYSPKFLMENYHCESGCTNAIEFTRI